MHTGIITFASGSALNIKSQDIKKDILTSIEDLCQLKIIQKHFDKLDYNSFSKLNSNPYLASLKTNGNPYYLYLTKYDFINQCIFIDKKVQAGYFLPRMIISRFEFCESLFNNTLLEGEMLKNEKGQWIFIINDIIVHNNYYLEKMNFLKRLSLLHDIMNTKFRCDKNDICYFQIKKYVTYNNLQYLVKEFLPSLSYTCRGIYFQPLYLKFKGILNNFDDSLITEVSRIKYQNSGVFISKKVDSDKSLKSLDVTDLSKKTSFKNVLSCSTFRSNSSSTNSLSSISDDKKMFLVEKTELPDVYNLYDCHTNQKHGIACVPYMETSKLLLTLFHDTNLNNRLVMECEYKKYFNKWVPLNLIEVN